jgi:hypothetical protein
MLSLLGAGAAYSSFALNNPHVLERPPTRRRKKKK